MSHLFGEMKCLNLIGKSPRAKVLKHLKVVVLDLYIALYPVSTSWTV